MQQELSKDRIDVKDQKSADVETGVQGISPEQGVAQQNQSEEMNSAINPKKHSPDESRLRSTHPSSRKTQFGLPDPLKSSAEAQSEELLQAMLAANAPQVSRVTTEASIVEVKDQDIASTIDVQKEASEEENQAKFKKEKSDKSEEQTQNEQAPEKAEAKKKKAEGETKKSASPKSEKDNSSSALSPKGGAGKSAAGPSATERAPQAVPDISQSSPESGLSQLIGLSLAPDKLSLGLVGLNRSVGKSISDKRGALAQNPPSQKTKGGGKPAKAAAAKPSELKIEKEVAASAGDAPDIVTPNPEPAPEPNAPPPIERNGAPEVSGSGEGGKLSDDDVKSMASSINTLDTRDPANQVQAGPKPSVELAGNASPSEVEQSHSALTEQLDKAQKQALKNAAQPAGENAIEVTEPEQMLKAAISNTASKRTEIPALPASEEAETLGIIAGEQKDAEIKQALQQGQAQMEAEQQKHLELEEQKHQQAHAEIEQLSEASAAEQAKQKAAAKADVHQLRSEWSAEVDQQTSQARQEANAKVQEGLKAVNLEKKKSEEEAQAVHRKGEEEARQAQKSGEEKANQYKKSAKSESKSFFGWLASKAKNYFSQLKKDISSALNKARKAVKAAIDKAKKLATVIIERARKAIVETIAIVGKALLAIGDKLLEGFPELQKRFRSALEERIKQATEAVNAAAKKLNSGVQKALDMLGEGLDNALGLLEEGLLLVVDGIALVVDGALKGADAYVQALKAFSTLIKDIALGPLTWVANLGKSIVDGIQNHLWKAFKESIKAWFESKVMEVLGIGGMVVQTLMEAGYDITSIAEEAWEGLKDAIPIALVTILVEKLVAMIVPAAGAVMLIIESLQAAWGTVSRIITAFADFMKFLQKVKSGDAGPEFAQALASAAVVVIDFVSNWLIKKIRKAAKPIGNKFKKVASKNGKGHKNSKKDKQDKVNNDKDKDKKDKRVEITAADRAKHKKIGKLISKDLQSKPKSSDLEGIYKEKKTQAKQLKHKYQPSLKRGINLYIKTESFEKVKQDRDIDFKIVIKPNDYRANVTFFPKDKGKDDKFVELSYEALRNVSRSGGEFYFGGNKQDFRASRRSPIDLTSDKDRFNRTRGKQEGKKLEGELEDEEKKIKAKSQGIHQRLALAQNKYRFASKATQYPNNTFKVGSGKFFVETDDNYYIYTDHAVREKFRYKFNDQSKSMADIIETEIDIYSDYILKNHPSSKVKLLRKVKKDLDGIQAQIKKQQSRGRAVNPSMSAREKSLDSNFNSAGGDQALNKIIDNDADMKMMKGWIASLRAPRLAPSKQNKIIDGLYKLFRKNKFKSFKNYKGMNLTIHLDRTKDLTRFDYHKSPMSVKEAKAFYENFPNNIKRSSSKSALFLASVLVEPTRCSISHISNILLLDKRSTLRQNSRVPPNDKDRKADPTDPRKLTKTKGSASIYEFLPGSQPGSDPTGSVAKNYTVDPRINQDPSIGTSIKNVTDRDLTSIIRNPSLKNAMMTKFNKHSHPLSKTMEPIVIKEFEKLITDYLKGKTLI